MQSQAAKNEYMEIITDNHTRYMLRIIIQKNSRIGNGPNIHVQTEIKTFVKKQNIVRNIFSKKRKNRYKKISCFRTKDSSIITRNQEHVFKDIILDAQRKNIILPKKILEPYVKKIISEIIVEHKLFPKNMHISTFR